MDVSVCELVAFASAPIGFSILTVSNVMTSPVSMSSWVNCQRKPSDNTVGDTRTAELRPTQGPIAITR